MSTPENGNTTLSARDLDRVLSSIRTDAKKIKEALQRMHDDHDRLALGGNIASADVLIESIVTMRVALKNLADVFRVTF